MNAYDEISTIALNQVVIYVIKLKYLKILLNYLSLSCGFWSNSLMIEDSEFYE